MFRNEVTAQACGRDAAERAVPRRRRTLLLTTALGCSLVMTATDPARAQSIIEEAVGDVTIIEEVVNGGPTGVAAISDTGNVTVDIGQVNVINNDADLQFGIIAQTQGLEKLVSISVDELTAIGSGTTIGVAGGLGFGTLSTVINAGSVRTSGDGGMGVGGISETGSIDITVGSVITTGGYRDFGGFAGSAYGIMAQSLSGAVSITSQSVTTSGEGASGVNVTSSGAIAIDSDLVLTGGERAHGIMVNAGAGAVDIASEGIVTRAAEAHGIYVADADGDDIAGIGAWRAATGGTGWLTIDSGSIESVGYGMMIDHRGRIVIESQAITSDGAGIYAYGGDIIKIDSGSVQSRNGPGIAAFGEYLHIEINSGAVQVGLGADAGIFARTTAGGILINAGQTTTSATGLVNGEAADAIKAISDTGNIFIISESTATTGLGGSGIHAQTTGEAAISSQSIYNYGPGGHGILAQVAGYLTIDSGSIRTTENGTNAITVQGAGDNHDARIRTQLIITEGAGSHGVQVTDVGGQVVVYSDRIMAGGGGIVIDHAGATDIVSDTIISAGAGIQIQSGGGMSSIVSRWIESGSAGILASSGEGPIHINSVNADISGSGGRGIFAETTSGDIIIEAQRTRTQNTDLGPDGETADAVSAVSDTGDIGIASGQIQTVGRLSSGISATTGGRIQINSSAVANAGLMGSGILVDGGGAVTVGSGYIAMTGEDAWGININAAGPVSLVSDVVNSVGGFTGLESGGGILVSSGGAIDIESMYVQASAEGAGGGVEGGGGGAAIVALSDQAVTIDSDEIDTTGHGVFVQAGGDVSLTTGRILGSGDMAYGVLAVSDAQLAISSGAITMSGDVVVGLYAEASGDATVISQSIVSTGGGTAGEALGLFVGANGLVSVDSGFVSTAADGASAIAVMAGGDVTVVSDSIETTGAWAHGVHVRQGGDVTITTGDIEVTGAGATAVVVAADGAVDVTVDGDVSSVDGFGLAFEANAGSTAEVLVSSGSTIHGGLGAIYLQGDADAALTVHGRLSSEGAATVRLAGGDDVVNLMTGADIDGGLQGGAGFDTLNLNSTVNEGADIGQSIGDVAGFEVLNVTGGRWTLRGDAAVETTLSAGALVVTGSLTDDLTVGQLATLQIGDGGTSGDLIGDLVVAGTLIFNRSDDYDFGGDISGSGTLVKEGAGGLVLSGAYNFLGDVELNGGSLRIVHLPETTAIVVDTGLFDFSGTDQTISGLSGGAGGGIDIDGGSLTLDQDGSTQFAGIIFGAGALTLTGGGTLDLTGDNTYTGPTMIEDGVLRVNGAIASSVTVGDGAVLGGSGLIGGDVTVGAGGFVSPGSSPGLLTVGGDFTFAAGSTYAAEVEANGDHDRIDVLGETTIGEGVTLAVTAGDGDYARISSYTLLTSVGGVTGEFDHITTNLAFLTPYVEYAGTEVELRLIRNDIAFSTFASNANQASVADVIQAAGGGDPLFDALVVQSAEDAQRGYALLSGELYASLPAVLVQQARHGREAILERVASAPEGGGAWGELIGAQFELEETGTNAGVESDSRGFATGADAAANGWRAGVALTHMESEVEASTLASTSDVTSTSLSGYAGAQMGVLQAAVGATYTRHDVEAARSIVLPSFTDSPTAEFEARGVELFAEVSASYRLDKLSLQPFVGFAYSTLDVDGFTEDGGDAALTVTEMERRVATAKIGLRASGSFQTSLGALPPHAAIALQGVAGEDAADLDAAFQGAGAYAITGPTIRDGVAFDLGVRLDRGALGVSAGYEGVSGEQWSDTSLKLGLSYRF